MSLLSKLFGLSKNNNKVSRMNKDEFRQTFNSNKGHLIDVRTSAEFGSGHINGAKNIDIYSSKFRSEIEKLDKSKPIYVYCKSGGRSSMACKVIMKVGFDNVYELKGGYMSW